jgi:hypothetical protein
MEENGKNIIQVIKHVQKFFNEIAQVIQKVDDLMGRDGWNHLYKNIITDDVSRHLENPDGWLPYMNFRVYVKEGDENTLKGITFNYDIENEQPRIMVGKVEFKDRKKMITWENYWIIWKLWELDENETKKLDGTVYDSFKCKSTELTKEAKLFAYNLVDINNEADITNKIVKPLLNLN